MEEVLEKKAREFIKLSNKQELKEYAYNWVLFQYKIEELNNFIDEIRKETELKEDLESENGLFSGIKGNNTSELETDLKEFFINEYM